MTASVVLRRCPKCGWAKPREDFGRLAKAPNGSFYCRDCTRDYQREWKAKRKLAKARWLAEKGLVDRRPGVRVLEGETPKQENAGR